MLKKADVETEIKLYLSRQPLIRQNILTKIHETIVSTDKSIKATVEPMMGNELIVYKGNGLMKYGLAGLKNYMTLHVMPIYGSTSLFLKYKLLLSKAKFQKGCINFNNEDEMPLDILYNLINECSSIDLVKIKEDYLKQKN